MSPSRHTSPPTPDGAAPAAATRRVLLLGAPFDTGNLGVNALGVGALAMLAHARPGVDVAILDYGRQQGPLQVAVGDSMRTVARINLRFSWKPWLANNIATLLLLAVLTRCLGRRLQAWLLRDHRWLGPILAADQALALSGGDSFADLYGLGRLWYVLLPQWLVLALGVPLVLLPQTIGPFRRPLARRLAGVVLRRATRVFARERAGVAAARVLAGTHWQDQVAFCPDMAFLLPPRLPDAALAARAAALLAPTGRPRVALNVSGLLAMGGYGGDNDFGLRVDHLALCQQAVTWLVDVAGADVLLLPHVVAGTESDVAAAQSLLARLPLPMHAHVRSAGEGWDAGQVKWLAGHCELLVGARMHACIAALSQGIPAVGLAYSDKFAGVFETVGAQALVADQRTLGAEDTLALVQRAFRDRAALAARLAQVLPGVRERVQAVVEEPPAVLARGAASLPAVAAVEP